MQACLIRSTLAGMMLEQNRPSVVMHHSPAGLQYLEQAGADLLVAGHTYGGQLFPGSPLRRGPCLYNRGLYRRETTQIFVTIGAGTFLQMSQIGICSGIDLLKPVPAWHA